MPSVVKVSLTYPLLCRLVMASSDSGGFGDLVQQAQQLTAEIDSGVELPRVERNLFQIMEEAQRMASRQPHIGQDSSDVKA